MNTESLLIGTSNCLRLHIHSEPNLESEIVCKVRYLTRLAVDTNDSTDEFYKVYTAFGAEGFCQKEFVNVKMVREDTNG